MLNKVLSYKVLIVWQKGMDLAALVYQLTAKYPKEELYSLTNPMRRAAVSIVSNIAEGKRRESKQEYLHFLAISQGSLTELETQLLLSIRLLYLSESGAQMLTKIRSKLKVASLTPKT